MSGLITFLKNDCRMFLNLRHEAGKHSVFKAITVAVFALAILSGLFFLFLDAFKFLNSLGGIGLMIIQRLFGLFFFGLGIMLVLSTIITAYAVYFRSEDLPFLLIRPVSRGTIAVHKLFESAWLSSWAFFIIMIPFVAAFAWHQKLPLIFAFWTVVYSLPFVMLCSAMGVILIIAVVRYFPNLKGWIWAAVIGLGLGAFCIYNFMHGREEGLNDAAFLLTGLIPGIKAASFPLWPSWWVSEGIMAMVRGIWGRGLLLFGVLLANLLFAVLIVEWIGNKMFYCAWERRIAVGGHDDARKPILAQYSLRCFDLLPSQFRAIVLKDVKTFMRDPVQIIQGLLFFGLLGIYFFNLRNLHYHLLSPVWRNLISFLNLFSLATIMSSLCSRFIFPQISLEGHAFWIIGLSPVNMSQVLRYKFTLAVSALLAVSMILMAVSTFMLGVTAQVAAVTLAVSIAVSFGLCGMALGLGAFFMDLKQTNPVAIISGFGGTFNLVASLVYIMAAIVPFGFLCHMSIIGRMSRAVFIDGMILAALWLIIITFFAAWLPLSIGRRTLMSREY